MKKRLPRLIGTFNRQITREIRELMQDLELPFDAFLWSLPNIDQPSYRDWYQKFSRNARPRREFLGFLADNELQFETQLNLSNENWHKFEMALPDHLKPYFTHEDNGQVLVSPRFLLDKNTIKQKRQETLLAKKAEEELHQQDIPVALIEHLKMLPPADAEAIKKEFEQALKAKHDREREQAMDNVNRILQLSLIPFGVQWVAGSVYVSMHPIVNRLDAPEVSKVLSPLTRDLGIGMFSVGVSLTLFNGLRLFSNEKTTLGEKREFLAQESVQLISIARRFAELFSPGVITTGYLGIASSLYRFVSTELSHQLKIARLTHELKDSKAVLTGEVDRLLAEYQRAREYLLGLYKQQPNQEVQLQFQLKKLTDYYEKAIHDAANTTAKSAVTLQADLSYRRIGRVSDVVQMGLAMGANFFPPLYMGLLVTQLADVGVNLVGREYVKNTAMYNQGYQLPNVIMLTDQTKMRQAFNQIEHLSSFTVASLPLVVRPRMSLLPKHRLDKAMRQIETTNSFLLQMPYTIREPAMTNGAVMRSAKKVIANAMWLEMVYQKIQAKYAGKIPPEMANLMQLRENLTDNIEMVNRRINNQLLRYDDLNSPSNWKKRQKAKLLEVQDQLGRLEHLVSRTSPMPERNKENFDRYSEAARSEFVEKEVDDIIRRSNQYTEFLKKVPARKVVLNLSAIEEEIQARLDRIHQWLPKNVDTASHIRMGYELKRLKQEIRRLRPPLEPQPEQQDSVDQFVGEQAKRLQSTQSLLRSAHSDEIRIVPANVAFGLTKNAQLRRNARKTLKTADRLMSELPQGSHPKLLIQSYDVRSTDNITSYRKLAGRVEGLKTEIQQLQAVLDLAQGNPKYVFADLYDTYQRYESALGRFEEAKRRLNTQPKPETRWQRFKATWDRFFYERSTEKELVKATTHLGKFYVNIPEDFRDSTENVLQKLSAHEHEALRVELLPEQERVLERENQNVERQPLLQPELEEDESEGASPHHDLK